MEQRWTRTIGAVVRRCSTRFTALLIDAVAWHVGLTAAVLARYEFTLRPVQLDATLAVASAATILHAVFGHGAFLHRGRYRYGSFEELRVLGATVLGTSALLLALVLAAPAARPVPASVPIVGGFLTLVLMLGARYVIRLARDRRLRPDARRATPVLLFGAGAAGRSLVRAMLQDPACRYLPVGLLDDDPDNRHLRVHGLPVLGGRDHVPGAIAATGARMVVFSVANADGTLVREVQRRALAAGAEFKTVPSVSELLDAPITVTDVRDVQVTDLLGRHQIETDLEAIAHHLRGKRVLITGAGGSIGSELCRQVHRFGPAELVMLDRDESALHAVQLSLFGRALLDSPDLVLADLRDAEAIEAVFAAKRPEVVFHAAALKHLPLLENHPAEALKTNVLGTLNVLTAARGVERFVNISTDKAARPASVLGYSKRITERLTAWAAGTYPGTFLSVRFGNVLGSRGSVLGTFTAQAAAGHPITVTHPDVTRFFMTVQEAVQLVVQASAIGRDGEALVLSMGEPVRIAKVARQIADLAPLPVEITYTGLRPGEKLHEELFGPGEFDVRPIHPLISHVRVPPLRPATVRLINPVAGRERLREELARLCDNADVRTPIVRTAASVSLASTGSAGSTAQDRQFS
jgi:FlaA1/EpsC-like NDP-sugar epimerase